MTDHDPSLRMAPSGATDPTEIVEPPTAAVPVTRRGFIAGAGAVGSVPWWPGAAEAAAVTADTPVATLPLRLIVNGREVRRDIDPRTTLLDLLREGLDLPGTKKGCDHGQCGACTVLIDGRRANACLALAALHDGAEVTTVEGLARADGDLHPLQAAFIEHDAFQCGYCTPGQLCSAVGMLDEAARGAASHVTADLRRTGRVTLSDDEIRERLSGNLCRCGAYPGIVAAVRQVAVQPGAGGRRVAIVPLRPAVGDDSCAPVGAGAARRCA